jgi:hypothetical protein
MNGAPLECSGARFFYSSTFIPPRPRASLVPVVIMIIPIAIGVPAVAVFVPPPMPFVPAAFPRFVQLVARVLRLPAVPPVMLGGFVQLVIRLGNAPLATVVVFGGRPGCSCECQHAEKRCRHQQGPS